MCLWFFGFLKNYFGNKTSSNDEYGNAGFHQIMKGRSGNLKNNGLISTNMMSCR
jgi:hypothetical protein